VLDELTTNLVKSKRLTVIDRKELDLIKSEMDFQMSGEVSDESMQSIGKKLGAQSIVSGSLTKIGNTYRIVIRVLNVQSATIEVQYRTDITDDDRVEELLITDDSLAYKIGDIGPAGGFVFYDKGVFSDGWRYLEAAPYDIGPVQFSKSSMPNVQITDKKVGSGKANTAVILTILKQNDDLDKAAYLCSMLNINGYNDWFLPSSEELKLIYTNLALKGLGVSSHIYWSSTLHGPTLANGQTLGDVKLTDTNGVEKNEPIYVISGINATNFVRAVRAF
jgi:TolB-like protein